MRLSDIESVTVIERQCYPSPWPAQAFRSEITKNQYADYIVAERERTIVGYAGMWLFLHAAHVTNIAVCPDDQGKKLGSQLLLALMERSVRQGLTVMTLEVRASNVLAQTFYRRYGFRDKGIRKGYYVDTGEDAIAMQCDDIRSVIEQKG